MATEPLGIVRICDSSTVQVRGEPDPSSHQPSGVDEYLRDFEKQQAREHKARPSSRNRRKPQRERITHRRRRLPHERHPLIIISGLVALVGVFLAGFALHQLAFLVISSAVIAVVTLVFYPPRCPRCGAYLFRRAHACDVPSSPASAVYMVGDRRQAYIARRSLPIIKGLAVVNGVLFFALLGYLVAQIVAT